MSRAPAIYYAIDDHPRYLFYAARSVETLRRHNRRLPVRLLIFGPGRAAAALYRDADVEHLPPVAEAWQLTFLKWRALPEVAAERLAFLDADTLFTRDPAELFARCRSADFYAREEAGHAQTTRIGRVTVEKQLDVAALARMRRVLRSRALPVFNTGLMVFNRGAATKIARRVGRMEEIGRAFHDRTIPFPGTNPHVAEEVAASLELGCVRGLTWRALEPAVSPWYAELLEGELTDPGVVVHTFASYYPLALLDLEGRDAVSAFLAAVRLR